jgi:hypothetical protein
MPRRLLERCPPDSIREFRASARQRFDDGLVLAGGGQRTAAIYLWGYTAEMTLKAAYFSLIALAETAVIRWTAHIVTFRGVTLCHANEEPLPMNSAPCLGAS